MGSCTSSVNRIANTTYNIPPTETRRNNSDLINVIPVYDFIYDGRYARYFKLKRSEIARMQDQLEFGDLLEIVNPCEYSQKLPVVVGPNHALIPCCHDDKTIIIPYSICSHLDHPVACYSKLLKRDDQHEWLLTVKHDDDYIVHRFGGPLAKNYQDITLHFQYGKLEQFEITHPSIGKKTFDTLSYNFSNHDIDAFYRVRTGPIYNERHKTTLVIVELGGDNYEKARSTVKYFPSPKWEYVFRDFYEYNQYFWREYLIGPRGEEKKMLQCLQREYGKIKHWIHPVDSYLNDTTLCNLPYTVPGGTPVFYD
mmetsp:Transcript_20055/g.31859  ORF Transcript_20055/g.31859 Transcript_20055/m.31859 type:complete len:310 (-) Transcript_20055:393-1322(-)